MRIDELIESIVDNYLIIKFVQFNQECQRLGQKFNDLVQQHGYESARKLVLDRIPDFSDFKWHIQFAAQANPNVKKSYDNMMKCFDTLKEKMDSGV